MKTFDTVHAQVRLARIYACLMKQPMTVAELAAEIHLTPTWTAKWMVHLESEGVVHVSKYIDKYTASGNVTKVRLYSWGPGSSVKKPEPKWPRHPSEAINRRNKQLQQNVVRQHVHKVKRDPLVAALFGDA